MIEDVFILAFGALSLSLLLYLMIARAFYITYCPKCERRATGRYCTECGAKAVKIRRKKVFPVCQNCKSPIFIWERYCPNCGRMVKRSRQES